MPGTLLSDKSLLRYPGGKTRAVEIIAKYFPDHLSEMCSPFLGGASIELYLAARGVKVYGSDIFRPLVEFWQCVTTEADELAAEVEKYFPLERAMFYQLQQEQVTLKTKVERAAVFYVLNRSSFSGSTLSGGMSPHHPRFTQTSIERLKRFYNPNMDVQHTDFKEVLSKRQDVFAYLDPPYLISSTLYGRKGDTHKNFDHVGLMNLLRNRGKWIMSYNDCHEIHEMYKGHAIIKPVWKYGMSNNKRSKEVLIFSDDLAPRVRGI